MPIAEPSADPDAEGCEDDAPAIARPEDAVGTRGLDDHLRAILREEAEREAAARQADAARKSGRGLELQGDLGIADTSGPRRPAPRPAPVEPEDSDPQDFSFEVAPAVSQRDAVRGARRDLLPDIEQINSTLRASSENRRPDGTDMRLPEQPEVQRKNFRVGFASVVTVAVIVLALYGFAPRISAAVPALGPAMTTFVSVMDKGRAALDAGMARMLSSLQGAQNAP